MPDDDLRFLDEWDRGVREARGRVRRLPKDEVDRLARLLADLRTAEDGGDPRRRRRAALDLAREMLHAAPSLIAAARALDLMREPSDP